MGEGSDPGSLKFKKRVLARVEIDDVDLAGSGEKVIEGVSPSAGDDEHDCQQPVRRGYYWGHHYGR